MAAYGTDAGLTDYAAARGVTLSGTTAVLLTKAHDYIETFDFIGCKATEAQVNQWPRYDAVVDGYYLDSATVPTAIIEAEYEAAMSIDAGVDPLAVIERGVKRERVETLETEYQDGALSADQNRSIMAKLRKYIVGGASGFVVNRG